MDGGGGSREVMREAEWRQARAECEQTRVKWSGKNGPVEQ